MRRFDGPPFFAAYSQRTTHCSLLTIHYTLTIHCTGHAEVRRAARLHPMAHRRLPTHRGGGLLRGPLTLNLTLTLLTLILTLNPNPSPNPNPNQVGSSGDLLAADRRIADRGSGTLSSGDLLAAGAGVGAGASPSAATGASAGAGAGSSGLGAGAGAGWLRLAQAGAQAPAAAPAAASSPQLLQGSQTQSAGQIYFEG